MISKKQRVSAFINLGHFINDPANEETISTWVSGAKSKNNWFTPANVRLALDAIARNYLDEQALSKWADTYAEPASSKKVGVVMAGNIPAAGFHDAMAVLISGHTMLAKPSSDDQILITALLMKLGEIEPAFKEQIRLVERLNEADAYIATGSDNTARYFHYYFGKKPNIIRKNRTSVAVLHGNESDAQLRALGSDVLQYFGLGCRNVSKLFVPAGYNFTKFYEAIQPMENDYLHHHKYFNNYEYNKSIFLVNGVPHVDNGFLLINESQALVSPISVLHFETYGDLGEAEQVISAAAEKIQCVVGEALPGAIAFGEAQQPALTDYADGIDTMDFLSKLA